MVAIMMKRNNKIIKKRSNILITGLGNVGIGTLFELIKRGRKKITIFLRNENKKKIIEEINHKYKMKIEIINNIDKLEKFDTIIDATGSKEVLENIINNINTHTNLVLMGTPRDGPDINLLYIHRKNIKVIGAHEINGIKEKERQEIFSKTLRFCSKNFLNSLDEFIVIHKYEKSIVSEAIKDRKHIIHIFKY